MSQSIKKNMYRNIQYDKLKLNINKYDNYWNMFFYISFIIVLFFIIISSVSFSQLVSREHPQPFTMTSVGTYSSIVGIVLALIIFYIGSRSQKNMQSLSEAVHRLSLTTYKNQTLQIILDNYLKTTKDTKENNYWHYRFSFENYDFLKIKIENYETIRIKIKGTNIAPFQAPSENIITYMYNVAITDSDDVRLPQGDAYCSFVNGKKMIGLKCNQLDLIEPMYQFEISGPDVIHSKWISDMPKFYKRIKNTTHFIPNDE